LLLFHERVFPSRSCLDPLKFRCLGEQIEGVNEYHIGSLRIKKFFSEANGMEWSIRLVFPLLKEGMLHGKDLDVFCSLLF
jgi:hypothetical protein